MSPNSCDWTDSQTLRAAPAAAEPLPDEVALVERWAGTAAMAVIGLALMTVLMV